MTTYSIDKSSLLSLYKPWCLLLRRTFFSLSLSHLSHRWCFSLSVWHTFRVNWVEMNILHCSILLFVFFSFVLCDIILLWYFYLPSHMLSNSLTKVCIDRIRHWKELSGNDWRKNKYIYIYQWQRTRETSTKKEYCENSDRILFDPVWLKVLLKGHSLLWIMTRTDTWMRCTCIFLSIHGSFGKTVRCQTI